MPLLLDDAEDLAPLAKAAGPTAAIGSSGLQSFGGYVLTGERSAALQGTRRFQTYADMLANTSIVATGTRHFLNILTKASWSVQPAKDEHGQPLPGAQEVADLVEACMGDMATPWFRVVRRAAMYRYFGFSVQEWTAKRRADGRIGIADVSARPQVTIERWDLDPTGSVLGCFQRVTAGAREVYLPRSKFIHMVDDALNDSPEGLGLLRHAVRACDRLRGYEDLEQVGFETDLRGIPVGRAPISDLREQLNKKTITGAQFAKALSAVDSFVKNHIKKLSHRDGA